MNFSFDEHFDTTIGLDCFSFPFMLTRYQDDWCYVAAIGAAGGILLMWDKRVVSRLNMEVGECVVACSFKNVVDGFEWAFARVYGPNGNIDRRRLWDELAGLLSWWDLPWCIGGDFNVIRFPSERSGGRHISAAMREFSDFIFERGHGPSSCRGFMHMVQYLVLV